MRPSVIHSVMPDWNGHESIVAYHIRKREERRMILRLQRDMLLILLTPIILIGVVGMTATLCKFFL